MDTSVSAGKDCNGVETYFGMNMTDSGNRSVFRMEAVLDRTVFFVYCFCYLAFFQSDLERYVHRILTDDAIPFRPIVLATLFSVFVTALEIPLSKLLRFRGAWEAVNFVPLFLLLGLSTSYTEERFLGHELWGWIAILAVAMLLILVCRVISQLERVDKSDSLRNVVSNMAIMSILAVVPPIIGNSDETLHRDLRAVHLLETGQYGKVLKKVGRRAEETSYTLERCRAESMARAVADNGVAGSLLGEMLFDYPQKYSGQTAYALLQDTVATGAERENREVAALLLRKQLAKFSDRMCYAPDTCKVNIAGFVPVMPIFYMQALVMQLHNGDTESYELLESLYPEQTVEQTELFLEYLERKNELSSETERYRANSLAGKFGHTYFFYYDFL